jgi:spore germination cell wall hydrolase CwlJ-like protein
MAAIDASVLRGAVCLSAVMLLSACTSSQTASSLDSKNLTTKVAQVPAGPKKQVYTYSSADRECLKRAMYFESKRSSENGFMAVGSVIMNRMTSGLYPETICGVVKQEKQFAPGVMSRKMDEDTAPELNEVADAVLKGKRHPDVKEAMFFHTAGLRFPYKNMHYVANAGGNVFYEKRDEDGNLQTPEPKPSEAYVMVAEGTIVPTPEATSMMANGGPMAAPAAVQASTPPMQDNFVQSGPARPMLVSANAQTISAPVFSIENTPLPSAVQAYQAQTGAGIGEDSAGAAILSIESLPDSVPVPKRRPVGIKADTSGDMVMTSTQVRAWAIRTSTP